MTIFQAIILGVVQGLTEFLPISSSGHLVLVPALLQWQIPADQSFVFNVLVQIGTLFAVFFYFWNDLVAVIQAMLQGLKNKSPFSEPEGRLGWLIIVSTIPAGTIGLLIKEQIQAAFSNPVATSLFLLLTAVLLIFAERKGERIQRESSRMTWIDSLIIGLFQILAVFPGVSRSGSTIAGGMTRHLSRTASARFSFLMAIPIMLAAGFISLWDLSQVSRISEFIPSLLIGFLTSTITGYLSIRWLLGFLKTRSMNVFAIYVVVLSLGSLLILR